MKAKTIRRISRRNPRKQADYIVRRALALNVPEVLRTDDGHIYSTGTAECYRSALTTFCKWIQAERLGDLRGVSVLTVQRYLQHRHSIVGQKTLDLDRQAAQFLLQQNYGQTVQLPRIKSTYHGGRRLSSESRAYFSEQVDLIARNLPKSSSLAARIAFATGVRSRELLTLRPAEHVPASPRRQWSNLRFVGRTGVRYTVRGKGGLRREVLIPHELARELEGQRLDAQKRIKDRGTMYWTNYRLAGGSYLSRLISRKSNELLDWSGGLHGLRHGYVQDRMLELTKLGFSRQDRLEIISQELGHFRPKIVLTYLR